MTFATAIRVCAASPKQRRVSQRLGLVIHLQNNVESRTEWGKMCIDIKSVLSFHRNKLIALWPGP